jgi:hypothetical protein
VHSAKKMDISRLYLTWYLMAVGECNCTFDMKG